MVRPNEADLPGRIQFYGRPEVVEDGRWHLIGGPEGCGAPLGVRQRVSVYDTRLKAGEEIELPVADRTVPWMDVMDGAVSIGGAALRKGDAVTDLDHALPRVQTEAATTLVVFLVDRGARASKARTISGRQKAASARRCRMEDQGNGRNSAAPFRGRQSGHVEILHGFMA